MSPERAQELLAAERDRIERALADLGEPVGTDELATIDDPADQGSELYERELEEGLVAGLRRELRPSSGPKHGWRPAPTGSRSTAVSRFPTNVSRPIRWPSARSRKSAVLQAAGSGN